MLKKSLCIVVAVVVGLVWLLPIPFHVSAMGISGLIGGFVIAKSL